MNSQYIKKVSQICVALENQIKTSVDFNLSDDGQQLVFSFLGKTLRIDLTNDESPEAAASNVVHAFKEIIRRVVKNSSSLDIVCKLSAEAFSEEPLTPEESQPMPEVPNPDTNQENQG